MTIHTLYDLELKGIKLSPLQNILELDGITYTRGQTFALTCQELADRMCQSYLDEGYSCFIVSANQMLTLWRSEKLPEVVPQRAEDHPDPQVQPTNTGTASKLLYRGAPVLHEVSAEPPQKKKRTYRGVEY
jgi:hypothetical protein